MNQQRENRRALAADTLRILQEGRYTSDGATVDISGAVAYTNSNSIFVSQEEAGKLGECFSPQTGTGLVELRAESTLGAIIRLDGQEEKTLGVLNFASARNPGGGFLNGALAQEESLAAASSLYDSQIKHPVYYETNRACTSMIYTDSAIWSPAVVFFRNDAGNLLPRPAQASVLTLPAVNYGQVLLKKENPAQAKAAMKQRMKIALAIFAAQGCEAIILGAYGCGVFGNAPADVVRWWEELLAEYGGHFRRVIFAILARSRTDAVFSAFERVFGHGQMGNYNR